jgi:hypothetical protein
MKFAALWGLSVIAALALSWVAVSQVRDRVIQPVTVIPTTIVALEAATPDPTVVAVEPEVIDEASDPSTSSSTSSSTTSTTVRAPSSTNTTRAPSARPSTTTTTAPPQTTTTTAPPQTTTTTAPPQTTTTTAPTTSLVTSSYSVPGGSVTIKSAPGEVHFVSAIPQPGFTTELRDTGPERVRVRFVSSSLSSEFEAEWDNGELQISAEEHSP